VGRTDACIYPAAGVAALPSVGGPQAPSVATVLALQPDLVIASADLTAAEVLKTLEADGVPIWITRPRTVREALNLLWAIVRLFDAPHAGHTLAALERSYEIASQAADDAPRSRVFCPLGRDPLAPKRWLIGNRATYLSDLLHICGGANVFAEHEPVPGWNDSQAIVSPADVVAAAPEIILLPSDPGPFTAADLAAFDAWPHLPAVAAGRVYLVDGATLTWPGTHLARALAELPAILHIPPV